MLHDGRGPRCSSSSDVRVCCRSGQDPSCCMTAEALGAAFLPAEFMLQGIRIHAGKEKLNRKNRPFNARAYAPA